MNSNVQNSDEQQLDYNMQLMNNELCLLIDATDPMAASRNSECANGASLNVLKVLNKKFDDLMLDEDAPQFEFHGYGCTQTKDVLKRREHKAGGSSAKNKSKPNNNTETVLVSHQKQMQLQKENLYNQNECNIEKRKHIEKSNEDSLVIGLMSLFKSLHYLIWSDFPSHQLNSVPSCFMFDTPMKCTLPKGFNVRHHVQVLCTKLERFLERLQRALETNRNLDLNKYTDCNAHLGEAFHGLRALQQFTTVELRQRSWQFINDAGIRNGRELQMLLSALVNRLKTAHIYVHTFNWEMDLEHRYSAAMTARHSATISKSLSIANNEYEAAKPLQLSREECFIAERYQLYHGIMAFKKHKEFLTALVHNPENYFPPEIIALCEPRKHLDPDFGEQIEATGSYENLVFAADILELPPSSPPRITRRRHAPYQNRGS
ncbi:protein bag-of-marbles [Drosophila albomicans]|uniref:Protein bag-of-marbles n=1 Tax=Drosophila albomicans TaxID=7291 RepID=A0A6P8XNG9_DROAB|nr:protein bag-of-marbles [Drosophila albomicans]